MNDTSWINNPALSAIDPAKLQMLLNLTEQAKEKKQNELLPFLMSAASMTQNQSLSFQSSEVDSIINVLKAGKSPQEKQRIDRLCALIKQLK